MLVHHVLSQLEEKKIGSRTLARRLFLNPGCVAPHCPVHWRSTVPVHVYLVNPSLRFPAFIFAYARCRSYRCCVLCVPLKSTAPTTLSL